MATMKTLNGYGFNATELNGKAASDYLQKTDTASDSAKLGGKAPEYYIQPRNLLDNSDFRNPVNQRGETSYSGVGYTIDRWNINVNLSSLAVNDGYITATAKPSVNGFFQQYLESKLLFGKTLTFAVKVKDGDLLIASGQYPPSDPTSEETIALKAGSEINIYINAQPNKAALQVRINNGSTANLEWAALYEGSYTAETLPPYVPKGYSAELAECDLHYRPLGDNVMSVIAMTSSDGGVVLLKSIRPMRDSSAPTIINNGTLYARVNGIDYTLTDVRILKSNKSGVEILANASGAPSKQTAMIHGSALLALSRDL